MTNEQFQTQLAELIAHASDQALNADGELKHSRWYAIRLRLVTAETLLVDMTGDEPL